MKLLLPAAVLALATAVLAASLLVALRSAPSALAATATASAPLHLSAPAALVSACVFGVIIWLGRTLFVAG